MKKVILSGCMVILLINLVSGQGLQRDMQFWRPYDQRGVNIFETTKEDTVAFEGMKVRIGGHFTQQWQNLRHSNSAIPVLNPDGVNLNQLMEIGSGTNLATANLNIDVALADGVRMNMISYLSSRHHPNTWVMGGFLQVDKLDFLGFGEQSWFNKYLTLRVGHMEINYGDAHFRRTNNGNAMWNPFVDGYIMDAFTTEVGGELFFQHNGWLAMASITGGEIQGGVTNPGNRQPNFIGKLGYDKYIKNDLRVRLTGSIYTTQGSQRNTLWGGDRAGSRYYMVMENLLATTTGNFTSGRINPNQTDNITTWVINPFVKYKGFEFFGNFERSTGAARGEAANRSWTQIGADLVYRFGSKEQFYIASRYNTVEGTMFGSGADVNINRVQLGGGWFVTKNILAKIEYVNQNFNGFPNTDIRHEGRFNGLMLEAVIGF